MTTTAPGRVTIVTEADLREQLRRPTEGARVVVPAAATLSPAAQDFVAQWRLEVVAADAVPAPASVAWDRPGTFPVQRDGAVPCCDQCGEAVTHKPDHLTQVDAGHFGPKNTPRMRLRGKLDSLQALTLLAAARAAETDPWLAKELATVAAYCRELLSAEYHAREVAPLVLGGLDEGQIHTATHAPESTFGVSHLIPDVGDPESLLWLNQLRCAVREAELDALDAFPPVPEQPPARASLVHALNRLSSGVYLLELQLAARRQGSGG
jgi:ethanolamine utilization cobalamin adenosyltransferase